MMRHFVLILAACGASTPSNPHADNEPPDEAGKQLAWVGAPTSTPPTVVPNRDSAVLAVMPVLGAKDYRAFRVPAGTAIKASGAGEDVSGTTIYCAGLKQRAAPQVSYGPGWVPTRPPR